MFEDARILGTRRDEKSIIVQTAQGTSLENFAGPAPDLQAENRYKILCNRYGKQWEERKPCTGGYNCAGMVWACRRTALPNPEDWRRVLTEDGYRKIRPDEPVMIGDIAVYFKKPTNRTINETIDEILHIGRICELRPMYDSPTSTTGMPVVRVLSKLDLTSGEVSHTPSDIFLNGGEEFVVVFYTDRPTGRKNALITT